MFRQLGFDHVGCVITAAVSSFAFNLGQVTSALRSSGDTAMIFQKKINR